MRIVGGTVSWAEVDRRSSKTGQRHSLGGFTGTVDYQADYQGDYGPCLPWLRAARWTGIGPQTVWRKGPSKPSRSTKQELSISHRT